jgi:hypothetical protein
MKPILCAITGKPLEAGDPIIAVPGTERFYGVKARALPELTDEKRREIEAALTDPKPVAQSRAVKKEE